MDTQKALVAIILSVVILLGYYQIFPPPQPEVVEQPPVSQQAPLPPPTMAPALTTGQQTISQVAPLPVAPAAPVRNAREVTIDTDLYTAVISEDNGYIKSFVLKNYREQFAEDSPGKQLIKTDATDGFPLRFSWGGVATGSTLYKTTQEKVVFADDGKGQLIMTGQPVPGLEVERVYTFSRDDYLIDMAVRVKNVSGQSLQGMAILHQVNKAFQSDDESSSADRFMFKGAAVYMNNTLEEYKPKKFKEGPVSVTGSIDWAAYEGNYFICSILPDVQSGVRVTMDGDETITRMQVESNMDTLQVGEEKVYNYRLYYGPKKLTRLKEIGSNLDRSVNFGWFDVIAKPTLWLLNFFYGFLKNYGIAIILVTIIFKAIFWPITHKGLKSMKNMQKLQPKMVALKERYKDDPTKMNQEVVQLYKTYKVNPLGGCLPMVLQIPVFFALYKVLLQSIELRHAPFMLWISDLSAPDRLPIGIDIPYLGGIPVLTLLMGASMFVQQKLTPTTADPTQAKIMMFLPVVFTFMFINFSSGLVLYWFVNNLLAIFQQQVINRQSANPAK